MFLLDLASTLSTKTTDLLSYAINGEIKPLAIGASVGAATYKLSNTALDALPNHTKAALKLGLSAAVGLASAVALAEGLPVAAAIGLISGGSVYGALEYQGQALQKAATLSASIAVGAATTSFFARSSQDSSIPQAPHTNQDNGQHVGL